MINPQWLELPMSGTNFHGPKDVRAIEVHVLPCSDYSYIWETELILFNSFIPADSDIGLDKSGYQVNIFLISPWKHVVGTH